MIIPRQARRVNLERSISVSVSRRPIRTVPQVCWLRDLGGGRDEPAVALCGLAGCEATAVDSWRDRSS